MAGRLPLNLPMHKERVPLELEKPTPLPSSPHTSEGPFRPFRGGGGPPTEERHIRSTTSTVLPSTYLQCPQSLRGETPNHRSIRVEQLHPGTIILNDKSQHSETPHSQGSSRCHSRSPRRIPSRPDKTELAQVFSLLAQQQAILLSSIAIWSECRPPTLHTNSKVSSGQATPTKHPCPRLPRRLGNMEHINRVPTDTNKNNLQHSNFPGLSHKLQKIPYDTITHDNMARSPLVSPRLSMGCHRRVQIQAMRRCRSAPTSPYRQQKAVGIVHGQTGLLGSAPQTPGARYLGPGKAADPRPSTVQGQEGQIALVHAQTALSMDEPKTPPTTDILRPNRSENDSMDRRVLDRLGGTLRPRRAMPGPMGSTNIPLTHQWPRASGSNSSHRSPTPQSPSNNTSHRQRSSQGSYQQTKNKSPSPQRNSSQSSKDLTNSKPLHTCPQDRISRQPDCRRPEQNSTSSDGVVATTVGIFKDNSLEGSSANRPHGHGREHSPSPLRITLAPSSSNSSRRIQRKLEPMVTNLHIPSAENIVTANEEIQQLPPPRGHHSPVAANSTMVPNYPSQGRKLQTYRVLPGAASALRKNSKWLVRLREMDRLQFLKTYYSLAFNKKVANTMVRAYRPSSTRQAETAWRAFKSWLPRNVTILRKKHMLAFLTYLNDVKKLAPRTILGYRNSLSEPIKKAFNISLVDKDFSLLARAQFNLNPPLAKKIPKWSLNHALESLQSHQFRTNTASLEKLFLKAIFLTALASGNRVSELAAITRSNADISATEIRLTVRQGFLYKNQALDRTPPPITFPCIGPHHQLCPGSTLTEYIRRTETLAKGDHLFVHPNTGCALTSGRLSYWLSKAIQTLDPNGQGSAHDFRKFAFSLAFTRGLPVKEIVAHGFWTTLNVFINKYLVPLTDPLITCVAGRNVPTLNPTN